MVSCIKGSFLQQKNPTMIILVITGQKCANMAESCRCKLAPHPLKSLVIMGYSPPLHLPHRLKLCLVARVPMLHRPQLLSPHISWSLALTVSTIITLLPCRINYFPHHRHQFSHQIKGLDKLNIIVEALNMLRSATLLLKIVCRRREGGFHLACNW